MEGKNNVFIEPTHQRVGSGCLTTMDMLFYRD